MAATSLLLLDIGTQSVRIAVLSASGECLFQQQQPLSIHAYQAGHIEQDPMEMIAAIRQLLNEATGTTTDIGSAALAIQRSTVVAWDRQTGQPLSPALSWQDTRAAEQVAALSQHSADIKQRSGLMLSPHYGASKLSWLLNHNEAVSDAYSRYSLCIGPLVSFVLFHLLQDRPYLCDESNAARTQLWNIHQRKWDPQLCELFNVPIDLLPQVKPTHTDYGTLHNSNIHLHIVCGDQNAAYFGAGELPDTTALINIGTGAFILSAAGSQPAAHPALLDTLAISKDNSVLYLTEATVNGAGAALDWAEKQWQTKIHYPELEQYLQSTYDLPVFINSIGGLGSPWWRSDLEPFFLPEHVHCQQKPLPCLGAIIESIVFMLHHNLEILRNRGVILQQCLLSGGLSRLNSLCQKLANLDQVQILRSGAMEATLTGLAHLTGHLSQQTLNIGHRFSPQPDPELQQRYHIFCHALTERGYTTIR